MPTNLPNRARITFNGSEVALSNEINTTLVNRFALSVDKDAVVTSVIQGGTAVYVIRVQNTGEGTLYALTLTDDLGMGQLTYADGSAQFFLNGNPIAGTAAVNSPTELVFTVAEPLEEDDSLMIIYAASVSESQVDDITNTVVAEAHGGSEDGCEVTDEASETISIEYSANVAIFKTASEETVSCGDTLTYTFTLMNTGNEQADDVNFVDELPEQFTVDTVSYTENAVTTPIPASDYTIEDPNTLIIPSASSSLEINVPAATTEGPGMTVITVTGTIG